MKDLVKKVAVGLATGALLANSMIVPALADIEIIISGNGNGTTNGATVNQTNSTTVTQTNVANVSNDIDASAVSGDNDADDNASDVSIDTGAATATVDVTNSVNNNQAEVGCNTCPGDLKVNISGNVEDSTNTVDVGLTNTTWVDQNNVANLDNKVDVDAVSGENSADDNTGSVEINTGSATAEANVTNKANANVAVVSGSEDPALLELIISGNGQNTTNTIKTDLQNLVTVFQDNLFDVSNDVEVDAVSGDNDADDNAGDVTMDTGAAKATANVDNFGNFNAAYVLDCCEFAGKVAITGNVEDSYNDVELGLVNSLFAQQYNVMGCEEERGWPWLLWSEMPWYGDKDEACNEVDAEAVSGENDADDNTGGAENDPEIDTGSATTEVDVTTEGNTNVFSTDNGLPVPPPEWDWDMDGNFSWVLWMLFGDLG